jgi:hypothetical protein
MAASADGRLELFALGHPDQGGGLEVWHLYQTAPAGGWSQWVCHGRTGPDGDWSPPRVAASADGRLELFASLGGGDLLHIWQTAPNNGWTPTWTSHSAPPGTEVTDRAALTRLPDGRLILFTVAATTSPLTEALWYIEQTASSNGWSNWSSLGTPAADWLDGVAVATSADGRLEVFAISHWTLWHIWQEPGGGWSPWTSHGTPPGTNFNNDAPVLRANTQGRLELFAVGTDGALWHIWQTTPSGGWSDWTSHGSPPGCVLRTDTPGLAAGADGRLELFAVSTDGQLWHIWQTTPSGAWSSWTSHGRPPQTDPMAQPGVWLAPAVALNSAQRLELFITGHDKQLWHIWQTAPGQGWSNWLSHGTPPGVDDFFAL